MDIASFMEKHFRHFNARETLEAARSWVDLLENGNKMFLAMAGAMSTAEIGIILSKMIRAGHIHAISCTGANLEEDIFNLVAHNDYRIIEKYRDLSPSDEEELLRQGLNRVTDTCIPETVMRDIEKHLIRLWDAAARAEEPLFPFEFFGKLIDEKIFDGIHQVPLEHSWVIAAHEMGIPVYTPGWEDSTLGNFFTARVIQGRVASHRAVRAGTEQFEHLVNWYRANSRDNAIGFFQIGGGIAGDFPICSVPSIIQDLEEECRLWSYFCQISDSTTSYGSYSGASPNEKITWSKLGVESPKFMINSDAAIIAPLIFQYVLDRCKPAAAKTEPAARREPARI